MYVFTWGGASIDFGGGALHYFHRFISRETRWRERRGGRIRGRVDIRHLKSTDTDVDVKGEGRLVSFRYTRLTLVQSSAPGGEAGFQPIGMRFECNGG